MDQNRTTGPAVIVGLVMLAAGAMILLASMLMLLNQDENGNGPMPNPPPPPFPNVSMSATVYWGNVTSSANVPILTFPPSSSAHPSASAAAKEAVDKIQSAFDRLFRWFLGGLLVILGLVVALYGRAKAHAARTNE